MLLIKGLAKVANDPIPQGARPDVVIGIGRHEDRRNRIARIDEVPIEPESGHRGHMDVDDQQAVSTKRGDARLRISG
jgi:hypothetical protein